jgi:hypothetical protein
MTLSIGEQAKSMFFVFAQFAEDEYNFYCAFTRADAEAKLAEAKANYNSAELGDADEYCGILTSVAFTRDELLMLRKNSAWLTTWTNCSIYTNTRMHKLTYKREKLRYNKALWNSDEYNDTRVLQYFTTFHIPTCSVNEAQRATLCPRAAAKQRRRMRAYDKQRNAQRVTV